MGSVFSTDCISNGKCCVKGSVEESTVKQAQGERKFISQPSENGLLRKQE